MANARSTWTPAFRFIDTATVTPDPETVAMADALKATMDTTLDQQIGTLEAGLDSRRNLVRAEEATMGNLIADALRVQTGSDIGLMNGGGIRGDRTFDTGATLTRRDILTESPFGNLTVVTELPGRRCCWRWKMRSARWKRGQGEEVRPGLGPHLRVRRCGRAGVAGQRSDGGRCRAGGDKLYTVAVNDYILGGGDGYAALGGGRIVTEMATGNLVATDVMNYVEKMGSVKVEWMAASRSLAADPGPNLLRGDVPGVFREFRGARVAIRAPQAVMAARWCGKPGLAMSVLHRAKRPSA